MRTSAQNTMPAVTDEDRLRAWHSLHPRGVPCPLEEALKVDMHRRLIECRARTLIAAAWLASLPPTTLSIRRVRLDTKGEVAGWCTQVVMGPREPAPQLSLLPPTTT